MPVVMHYCTEYMQLYMVVKMSVHVDAQQVKTEPRSQPLPSLFTWTTRPSANTMNAFEERLLKVCAMVVRRVV